MDEKADAIKTLLTQLRGDLEIALEHVRMAEEAAKDGSRNQAIGVLLGCADQLDASTHLAASIMRLHRT